jgi:hypothetical protein
MDELLLFWSKFVGDSEGDVDFEPMNVMAICINTSFTLKHLGILILFIVSVGILGESNSKPP